MSTHSGRGAGDGLGTGTCDKNGAGARFVPHGLDAATGVGAGIGAGVGARVGAGVGAGAGARVVSHGSAAIVDAASRTSTQLRMPIALSSRPANKQVQRHSDKHKAQ